MGWISYHASEYKKGSIDRKAEIEKNFALDSYKVLKSTMVGSTYYAAVQSDKTKDIFGYVVLTSVNNKDYYNFSYKGISEDMGPYSYDCPPSILKLLTPTENEYAKEWRASCLKKREAKKKLKSLPEKTKIHVDVMDEFYIKENLYGKKYWIKESNSRYYISEKNILRYGYQVVG